MDDRKLQIFIKALGKCPNAVVDKEEIVSIAKELGLNVGGRIAKTKLTEELYTEGYGEKLYNLFSNRIYIESWLVGQFYGLKSEMINDLKRINVITEEVKQEQRWSAENKSYYTVTSYPLSVLNYDKEILKTSWHLGFGENSVRLRIDYLKSEEQLNRIVEDLDKVFEITRKADIYKDFETNNLNAYINIKPLNSSEFEKAKYRLKIENIFTLFYAEQNKKLRLAVLENYT